MVAAVEILEERGPMLGRPLVDRIKGSAFHHTKELRVSEGGDLRILFAFDAERRPILLVGGDKHGQWDRWYRDQVPIADRLFANHQTTLLKRTGK